MKKQPNAQRDENETFVLVRGTSESVSVNIGHRPPWWQHPGWLMLAVVLALAAGLIFVGASDQAAALGAFVGGVMKP